jgi:hypothetical protein
MRTHLWRRLAALALAAVTGMVLVPGAAHASGAVISGPGILHVFNLTTDPATGAKISFLPDWDVDGNCTIYPDAEVVISPPDQANNGWGAFHSTTFTNRRGASQIMRGHFQLLDSQDRVLANVYMDGLYMPLRYTAYESHYYQPMFVTPANFFFATKIKWNLWCETR